ncbi:CDP-alcohol phosphatidyltransferase family protein [uncultured Desulfuromusa sp.]|uniref:CDP-alcohol phosphatidyltransferase family protein n=1 Tax=uncultured Desulfuromusa sp. TaxID=219183 RepID=UPI002AA9065F|nr:CDP-alcohol phosphatidyltransferase family protein [uncultured Desulfuromusa sp.]
MNESPVVPRPILSYAKDLPNLCSLAGLLCAMLGIYFAFLSNFPATMIGLIWAVFFDWSDGIIARRMPGRTKEQGEFGAQLDSLIDIVSFCICPAVILLSYGNFSPWYIPGAFVIVASGVIRLSYFNVFGLVDKSTYWGFPLDNNVIILVFLFLFDGLISPAIFGLVLYLLLMVLAALNVAPIKTPKFAGRWYYFITGYTLLFTILYGFKMLCTTP